MKNSARFLFVFAAVFRLALPCFADDAAQSGGADVFWDGIGRRAPFGRPFWADMHSTLIRAEAAYATNSPDYDWGEDGAKNRPYVFANLGADIPLWAAEFSGGKYGLCFTLPFMIDTWYDRWERETSPVINTAWRFGTPEAGFIFRLDSPPALLPSFDLRNWAVKVSFFKHESTHLGDELTIYRKDKAMPITRIDVLCNYAELILTVNDPDGSYSLNHGFKFGLLFNYGFKTGWYRTLDPEANSSLVEKSRFPFEIYAQYQFQSPLFYRGFQFIGSAEWRLRERFKYPYSYSAGGGGGKPNLVNCFNLFAGVRYDNPATANASKIGAGVRYYYGLNPYGQFRSMPRYSQWGLALLFEY